MNISNADSNSQTRTVTLPWGPGAKVPIEQIEDEVEVRDAFEEANSVARSYLGAEDLSPVYAIDGSTYGRDLDPSPNRILRKSTRNDIIVIETEERDAKATERAPSFLFCKSGDGSSQMSCSWRDDKIVRLDGTTREEDGSINESFAQVNGNGTLTMTVTWYPDAKAQDTPNGEQTRKDAGKVFGMPVLPQL